MIGIHRLHRSMPDDSSLDGEVDDRVQPREARLLVLLEEYLLRTESGAAWDRDRWVDSACQTHPLLAQAIRDGVDQIDALGALAGGDQPIIDGYQITRRLGQGGVGIVYEAVEVGLCRKVALKVFPAAFDSTSRAHARFLIEARAAARLDHPGIVPIYRIGEGTGMAPCFLSMKLVDGRSLDRVVADGPTPPMTAADWIAGAAEAIAQAHAVGVIHRDLKPSNLMVDGDGKIWVTDFGLARLVSDVASTLTASGDRVGTMAYMSPQQAAGRHVDGRADVYSLGLTLYELVTGRRALDGDTVSSVQTRREQTDGFHVRKVDRRLDRDLDTIIAKATATDADDRYDSAADFAADLKRYRNGQSIRALPPSWASIATRWLSRHRRAGASIAVLLVTVLVVSWIVAGRLAIANRRAVDALSRSQADLERTEEILDRFGLLAADKLRDVDGAQAVRRELLAQTLDYYQKYTERISGDAELIQQSAIAHFKAGSILDEINARGDAMAAFESASKLFDQAARLSTTGRRTQAVLWNSLAVMKADAGQPGRAAELYRRSIDAQLGLIAELDDASDREAVSVELARALGNYSLILATPTVIQNAENLTSENLTRENLTREDLTSENLAHPIDCIELGLSVLPEGVDNWQAATVRSMLVNRLAHLMQSAGQADRSEAMIDRAIDLLGELRNAQSGLARDESTWMLATAHANRAAITGDPADLDQCLSLMHSLRETFASDRVFLSELAARFNDAGRLLVHQGEPDRAVDRLVQARQILDRLCDRHDDADHYRTALAGVLHNLGRAHAISGRRSDAIDCFQRSLGLQERLRADRDRLPVTLQATSSELLGQTLADLRRVKKMGGR